MRNQKEKRLKTKNIFRLALSQGKFSTKLITIILSVFAFVLFSLGSMGFTYSYSDFLTRGYLNYIEGIPFISFNGANGKSMSVEDIELVEENTDLTFIYSSIGLTFWGTFIGDQIRIDEEDDKDISGATDLYHANFETGIAGSMALCGTAEDYESLGYSLLAGKYPTEKNEVAISEAHFEAFVNGGYCNVAKNFVWKQQTDEIGFFVYDESIPRVVEPISSYSDIIGKTVGQGDPEREDRATEYKIVGIVQTNYDYNLGKKIRFENYPAARWMLSEDWKNESPEIYRIFSGEVHDYETMKRCVDTVLAFKEKAELNGVDIELTNYPVLRGIDALFPSVVYNGYQDTDIIAFMIGAAGIVMGIFATILNGYLISQSIQSKQKKIGILRSMGADKKVVSKIFILESLMTATAIFLLSLISSLVSYYGFVRQLTTYQSFGVSFLVYNGWTALILAAVCYAVPLLSTVFPLKRFFKQSIVDNLSGHYKKKSKQRVYVKNCRK